MSKLYRTTDNTSVRPGYQTDLDERFEEESSESGYDTSASGYNTTLGYNTALGYNTRIGYDTSALDEESEVGFDEDFDWEAEFSVTETESVAEAEAAEEPDIEPMEALRQYREHHIAAWRASRAPAANEGFEVVQGYGGADLDEAQEFSISESLTETPSFNVSPDAAVQWWRDRNDPLIQARKRNSLMGWEKGETGWTPTGAKTEVQPTSKALSDFYANEEADASSFRGNGRSLLSSLDTEDANIRGVNTRYLRGEEQDDVRVRMRNGELLGRGGHRVDTNDASGIATNFNGGEGRFIFAMTPNGQMRAMDPWAGHQETPYADFVEGRGGERPEDAQENDIQLSFINHSSLLAGGEARGAGELVVDDGQVRLVSDNSGHYKPDNAMTHDVVSTLVDGGASPEQMGVSLVNKHKTATDRCGVTSGDLYAGALEFLSYGGATDAEARMRSERERRDLAGMLSLFDRSSLRHVETDDRSAPVLSADRNEGRVGRLISMFEGGL